MTATTALAIGWCATDRASDCIVSLGIHARGISLYFTYGAKLPDPHHLLQGNGDQGRFVRLENMVVPDQPEVKEPLRVAVLQAKTPLPATGRGQC